MSRRVLLTPLAIGDDRGLLVCIAIRDPVTEDILDTALSSQALAEKASIPLAEAQRIFEAVGEAADQRLSKEECNGEKIADLRFRIPDW